MLTFRRLPLMLIILITALTGAGPTAAAASLQVMAQSQQQIWNAVVHKDERTYLAGPRWTGSHGPQLTVQDRNGQMHPYPDEDWNAWTPEDAVALAATRFVNINALRLHAGYLWVVDTGAADFGATPLPSAAKLVQIDLRRNKVVGIYPFPATVALAGSYIDDVRFHDGRAFLTDAGHPGVIVLDLRSGVARRVLDQHPALVASSQRDIIVDGTVLRGPDDAPLRVHADPLEISPDGQWLYLAPLAGPWSKVRTEDLVNAQLRPDQLASRVLPFADLPPTGGTTMDAKGNLYFSDLANNALCVRRPDGRTQTLIQDDRLHWVDAPFLADDGALWLPAAQIDRTRLFNHGTSKVRWPTQIFRLSLPHNLH